MVKTCTGDNNNIGTTTYVLAVGLEAAVAHPGAPQPLLRHHIARLARLAHLQRVLVVRVGVVGVHHGQQGHVGVGVVVNALLQPLRGAGRKLAGSNVLPGCGAWVMRENKFLAVLTSIDVPSRCSSCRTLR